MSESDLISPPAAAAASDAVERESAEAVVAKPHPRIVTVWRIAWSIVAVVVSAIALVFSMVLEVSALWALGPALLVAALAIYWPGARWRAWSYRVGEVDVRLSHGVWWRVASVVPHARIQHVDTSQGPIDRAFGLAKVVIYTAGSVGAVEAIPGLLQADAEALRDRLAALGGSEDAL